MRKTVRPSTQTEGKREREGDSKLEWVVKINRVSSSSSKVTWGDRQKEWRKRKCDRKGTIQNSLKRSNRQSDRQNTES